MKFHFHTNLPEVFIKNAVPLKTIFVSQRKGAHCTAGLDDPEAVFTQVVEWMELCYGAVLSWGPDSHLDRPVYFCCEDD